MTVIINGSGTANGISYFSSPTTFGGTLATASRGISNASVPSGSVVQVVQGWSDTYTTGSSLNWVASPSTVSITPSSSSSKILVSFSVSFVLSSGQECLWRLKRNTTVIGSSAASATTTGICSNWSNGVDWQSAATFCQYLDSPATTSSITYSFEGFMQDAGGGTLRIGRSSATSGSDSWGAPSIITAMEIAQ